VKDVTLGDVFGTKPIYTYEILKLIWQLINDNDLRVDKSKKTKKSVVDEEDEE